MALWGLGFSDRAPMLDDCGDVDELDESTAIFKTRSDPPQGESLFVAEKDVPGDHYLWLTGMAGQLLRGKIKMEGDALPQRKN